MQCMFAGISALLAAVMLPVVLLQPPQLPAQRDSLLIIRQEEKEREICVQIGDEKETMRLEDYLIGVVMAEMPLSFPAEALKAQAVAARTYTYRRLKNPKHEDFDLCADSRCCQAWIGEEQIREKLGDSWNVYVGKAEEAVHSTRGLVLTYEDMLIDAVYFSCSGGHTEDAVAVWGSDVPYLQGVVSDGEEDAAKFRSCVSVSPEEFCSILRKENSRAVFLGTPTEWIGTITQTDSGSVDTMELGGQTYTGTQLRRLFGLPSTLFDLTYKDGKMVFTVLGNGHRVGMSQYGAAAMAENGKTYEEILHHYYQGVSLQKAPQ